MFGMSAPLAWGPCRRASGVMTVQSYATALRRCPHLSAKKFRNAFMTLVYSVLPGTKKTGASCSSRTFTFQFCRFQRIT